MDETYLHLREQVRVLKAELEAAQEDYQAKSDALCASENAHTEALTRLMAWVRNDTETPSPENLLV